MDWKYKTIIICSSVFIIMFLLFIVKTQYETIERLKTIETSMVGYKDLGDGLIRSQSGYATKKDLESIIKEQGIALQDVKKDLKVLGADLKGIQYVKVYSTGYVGSNIGSTETTPNPNPPDKGNELKDSHGYFSNTQWLGLTEPFEDGTKVPIGRAGFSAWQEKPWDLEILPRSYQSTTVLGVDEKGRHYSYNKFNVTVDNKTYTLPITESKLVERYPDPKIYFNPKLYLSIDFGASISPPLHAELVPNVGLSLLSYGRTKIDTTWSFLTFGLGYASEESAIVVVAAPINYNVGEQLPIVSNLHIGPSLSVDFGGNVGLYMGARVNF
ncbi:MAG: hypothetical protein WC942_03430 [Clostridia bacterium]|jgi:hypothetical protein